MTLGYDYAFKRFQCRTCRSDVTGFFMAKRALEACEDYFDRHATSEMLPDGPSANEEGQLLYEVGDALHQLRGVGDCPMCLSCVSRHSPEGPRPWNGAWFMSGAVAKPDAQSPSHSLTCMKRVM